MKDSWRNLEDLYNGSNSTYVGHLLMTPLFELLSHRGNYWIQS